MKISLHSLRLVSLIFTKYFTTVTFNQTKLSLVMQIMSKFLFFTTLWTLKLNFKTQIKQNITENYQYSKSLNNLSSKHINY